MVAQLQRKIKDLLAHIEELEEELENERQARAKVSEHKRTYRLQRTTIACSMQSYDGIPISPYTNTLRIVTLQLKHLSV